MSRPARIGKTEMLLVPKRVIRPSQDGTLQLRARIRIVKIRRRNETATMPVETVMTARMIPDAGGTTGSGMSGLLRDARSDNAMALMAGRRRTEDGLRLMIGTAVSSALLAVTERATAMKPRRRMTGRIKRKSPHGWIPTFLQVLQEGF